MKMKSVFWTTVFWIVVVLGVSFYAKMFNPNMATAMSNWLGVAVTTSGEPLTALDSGNDLMGKLNTIQTTLTSMDTKLDMLVGPTVPTVTVAP